MNKAKHTAGPWVFLAKATRENDSLGFSTFTANVAVGNDDGDHGNYLASVHAGGPGAIYSTREAVEANARLIAAAPDLLAALKDALGIVQASIVNAENRKEYPKIIEGLKQREAAMRAAIAKAEAGEGE